MYICIYVYTTNIYHLGCSNYMYFLLLKSPMGDSPSELRPESSGPLAFLARCQSDLWTPGPTKAGWIHLSLKKKQKKKKHGESNPEKSEKDMEMEMFFKPSVEIC